MSDSIFNIPVTDDPFGLTDSNITSADVSGDKPIYTLEQITTQLTTSWSNGNTPRLWATTATPDTPLDSIAFGINTSIPTNATSSSSEGEGLQTMSLTQITTAQLSFQLWDDLMSSSLVERGGAGANITLNYSNNTNNGTYTIPWLYTASTPNVINAEQIWFSSNYDIWPANDDLGMKNGGYGFNTMIHEIGHALGLSHPGVYTEPIAYATDAVFAQDNRQYTVMSYFGCYNITENVWTQDGTYWPNDGTSSNYLYPQTPMVYDIAAIQSQKLYNADTTTRTGDTIYGYNCNFAVTDIEKSIFDFLTNTTPIFTIWDAGGSNDALDCSGWNGNQTINLTPGSYSSVRGLNSNVGIAFGTTIENATGGIGNDTLIGNSANNIINGGAGTDTAVYGAWANHTVTGNSTSATVSDSTGADGTDTLNSIENLTFNGVTVTTEAAVNDAPVGVSDNNASDAVVEAGTNVVGDSSAIGNVLTNDTDADGALGLGETKAVNTVNKSESNVGGVVAGLYGSLVLLADGNYTYTLDNTKAATNALSTGQVVADTFTYTVVDAHGASSAPTTLSISITGSDDTSYTYNGHTYILTDLSSVTWQQAETQAVSLGGHLVTINDAAEQAWLASTFPTGGWIGYTDQTTEGTFQWLSGETTTYTNWALGEPNDFGGNEDYALMYPSGLWNDNNGSPLFQGIIEIPDSVNDAPTLTTFSAPVSTGNEDSQITVSFADLQAKGNEADIDGTVDAFVVKAVSSGTLKIGSDAATAIAWSVSNNTVDATHQAYWTPEANANGTLDAFTAVAKDNGGLESATPVQAKVNVTSVNDAPSFITDTVIFSDNFDADSFALNQTSFLGGWTVSNGSVDLMGIPGYDDLPGNGKYVDLDGTTGQAGIFAKSLNLTASTTYTAHFQLAGSHRGANADTVDVNFGTASVSYTLAASDPLTTYSMTFTPATSGSYSLNFHNQGGDNIGAILDTVSVTGTNSVSNDTVSYIENGAAVVLNPVINISDIELDTANNYNGASVTLVRQGGANAQDVFTGSGTLALSNGTVVLDNTSVGSYIQVNGELVISFKNNATSANVDNVLQKIAYSNSSDTPPTSVQINWTFNDGNTGAQGSGGALTALSSTVVNITAVNDAPTGTDKTVTINQGSSYTVKVADFGFSDPNDSPANAFLNVIVSSLPVTTDGVYKLGGVDVAVGAIISVTAISDGKLVFIPATNTNGTGLGGLGFKVQDDGGTVNGGVDTDATANTLNFNITAVSLNHAPVLTTPATINYTDTAFVDNFATVAGSLLASDVDVGNVLTYGIAGGTTGSIIDTVFAHNTFGELTVNTVTGAYHFDPNSAAIEPLIANATDSFTVTVSDGQLTDSKTLDITIVQKGITESLGNDTLTGTCGNDNFNGLAGNDIIVGGAGNDTINGGAGADTMIGGSGNDTYIVDNVGDVVKESSGKNDDHHHDEDNDHYQGKNDSYHHDEDYHHGKDDEYHDRDGDYQCTQDDDKGTQHHDHGGVDTVHSSITYTLTANIENLILTGTIAINGTGNELDNQLTGNDASNNLRGGDGNDTLTGGNGADTLVGGHGRDTYNLTETTAATDTLQIAKGDSLITGYDKAFNFTLGTGTINTAGVDKLDLKSTHIAANTAGVNGDNSGIIHSHSISNGIISFDDVNRYHDPLTITDANLADVFSYLQANISGNNTVAFVSNGNTFVFQDGGAQDTLVELVGVTAHSVNTSGLMADAIWIA